MNRRGCYGPDTGMAMKVIWIALAATACTAGSGTGTEGIESQGRALLGDNLDTWASVDPAFHASITSDAVDADGNAITVKFAGSASLRSAKHRGADAFFDGVTFKTPS